MSSAVGPEADAGSSEPRPLPNPAPRPRFSARLVAWSAVLLLLGAALLLPACRDKGPEPAQVSYELRDIYPFPAITGAGDDTTEYEPLQPGYFIYIRGEDFDAAAREFDRAANEHPDLIEARFLQGVSLVLGGHDADAVPVLEMVIEKHKDYAPAHWFLSQALFGMGREGEALEHVKWVARIGKEYGPEARKVLVAAERHGR